MPSIFVTPQPIYGRVLIQVNFSDTTATFVRVRRVASDGGGDKITTLGVTLYGTVEPVRVNTSADTSGDYMELSGGQAIFYDTEMPLDVALVYVADGLGDGSAISSPPPGIVVASGGNLWLKAPLRPWADQRVMLSVPQEPDCVPKAALFFQAMDVETRVNRTQVQAVNNRKNPIAMQRIRAGISSKLSIISRRFTDRDNVITLNAAGDPLLFQGPADYAIPDQYMSVDNYAVSRLTTDHRRPWRAHEMNYVEVDRPAGLAEGVLGVRWDDLCARYATFGAATAANLTWTSTMLGQGSLVPSPQSNWFYSTIPVQYATYTALNAAFPTYTDLWEGPF